MYFSLCAVSSSNIELASLSAQRLQSLCGPTGRVKLLNLLILLLKIQTVYFFKFLIFYRWKSQVKSVSFFLICNCFELLVLIIFKPGQLRGVPYFRGPQSLQYLFNIFFSMASLNWQLSELLVLIKFKPATARGVPLFPRYGCSDRTKPMQQTTSHIKIGFI